MTATAPVPVPHQTLHHDCVDQCGGAHHCVGNVVLAIQQNCQFQTREVAPRLQNTDSIVFHRGRQSTHTGMSATSDYGIKYIHV